MRQAIGLNNLQIVFDPVNLLSADNWQEADRMVGQPATIDSFAAL